MRASLPETAGNNISRLTRIMFSIAFIMAGLFVSNNAIAQGTMGRWEMCGLSGTPSSVSPTGVDAGVAFSTLTRGSGLTASSATGAFNSSGWSTSSTLSIGNNDYYEFTITPDPGHSISISALRIRDQMSNTSFDVSVRYSDNNYSGTIGSGGSWTASTSASNHSVNMSGVSSLQNRTTPITFRIYGTDASGSSSTYRLICQGTSSGNYRGVDVDGTVTHIPWSADIQSISFGAATWCQGETRNVQVTVKNTGSQTWNSAAPQMNIGLKWNQDPDYGAGPNFIPRQPAGTVAPGQTVVYTFPNLPAALATGSNNLTADVVREGICWFGNNTGDCGPGNSVLVTSAITVFAAPAATTVSGGGTFCNSRTITASGGTGGTIYFQGTTSGGTSTATPSTSQNITTSGTYYFRARNGNGCWGVEGSTTVTINTPSSINVQPTSQTICEGGTINLSVTASGSPAPTYQWKKNGSPIGGATSATYSIPSALNGDGGAYTVDVINTCSTVTSGTANVVVNVAPAITTDPATQTICAGLPVTFTVSATGTSLSYQWRKGGVNIGGATSASYTIPSVAPASAGNYDVVISNTGCADAISAAATLTVNESPAITLDPVSQTVCEGSNVTFTASASGVPAVTYQWQLNGSDITGETTSTLNLTGITTADNGSYTVIATNSCNSATSAAAVLVVNENPAVTVDPASQTICAGLPVTFTVSATGTNLTYQWRKGGINISGETASSYTIVTVAPGDAGNYDVVVSNTGCADATSASATLAVNESPVITLDPVSQTVCEGSNVSFTASASGVPGVTYQWQLNGSDITGETSSTLNLTGVTTADNGSYTVIATNLCNSATSAAAILLVNEAPAVTVDPASQTICAGLPVTFTVSATGTNLTYQWRKGGINISGETASSYTIASVAPGDAGNYDVVVSSTGCSSATSAAATLAVNESPVITLDPVSQTVCEGSNVTFTASASGVPGVTYQWQLNGSDISGETTSTLNLTGVTTADNGSYTVIATNLCNSATSAAAILLVNEAPAVTVDPVTQTVCAGQPVAFNVSVTGTNLTYQWRKGGINISGETASSYTIASVVPGDAGNYDVVVSNTGCTDATSAAATLTVNESPVITLDPVSQTVCEGSNVTFTASASGVPAVTYQWQLNGSDITGETGSTLNLSGVTTADNGSYTVIATNACNSATSSAATLLVNEAPVVTVDPASQTVCEGQPVTFTVSATGTNLNYQWRKNGSNIGGATSTSYTIPATTTGDAGTYDVVISNTGCADATSTGAVLVVNVRPTAAITSGNATICSTYPTTISGNITATGAWILTLSNGQTTGGTGSGTFSFIVTPASNTTYTLSALVDANCTSIAADLTGSASISTNPLPASVSIDPTSGEICNGQSIALQGNGATSESNSATLNNNFSSGVTVSGSTTGNRSQVFQRETSGSNVNSTGTYNSPNGTGMLVSTAAAQSSFCFCTATATSTANTTAQLTAFSTMGYNTLNLTFNHTYAQANVSGSGVVEVSTNGTTWTAIKTYSSNQGSQGSFVGDNISLNAYVDIPTLYIRFVYEASNSSSAFLQTTHATWWAIDDIAINGQLLPLFSWSADTGSGLNGLPAGAGTPSATNKNITVDPSASTTYTLTATNPVTGCATTSNSVITVNDRPTAVLSGGAVYCNGQVTTTTLSLAVTGAGTVSGTLSDGTAFSGTAPTITVDVAPVTTTTYTVATLSDANCTSISADRTGSATVTINARPTAALSGGASYCNGDVTTTTLTLTVTGSGTISGTLSDGTPFSGTAPTITVDVTPATTTTYTIATLVDNNCSANGGDMSGSATVTINPLLPVSVTIVSSDVDDAICDGTSVTFTATPVNGGTSPSYQWLLNGNPVGTDQDTYTTSTLANGDVVSVVLTSNITPCAVTNPATSNSIATVVNALQPVSVSIVSSENDNIICDGTSVTFTATPVNGGPNPSYQWLLNGNPVGSNQDTYTTTTLANGDVVSVVLTSDITPCATGNPATSNSIATTVDANQPVSVVIASDFTAVCAGSVINFSSTPTNEGTSPLYQWYINGVAVTDSTNTTFAPEFLADGDVVTVVLTSNITPCATQNPATSNSIQVTISPIPTAPGPISGITDACPYTDTDIPVTFTIAPVPGVADYTWTIPAAGVNIVSGQGTTDLTVTFTNSFALTNQYFRVVTNSSFPCSSSPSELEVLKNVPQIPASISGPTNICEFIGQPTTATYSIAPVTYATSYTWTPPANATIVSGQGTTSVEVSFASNYTSGGIRVVANSNCGSRAPRSLSLARLGANSPASIDGPVNACSYISSGDPAVYSITAVPNATSYDWLVPAGVNIVSGQGTTSLTVTFNSNYNSGMIRVRSVSACNTSGYRNLTVSNASYGAPGLISGPNSACSYMGTANVATYTVNKVLNAPAYLWTVPAGATIVGHPGGAGVNDTIIDVVFDNGFVNGSAISVQATGCITTAASSLQVFRTTSSGTPGMMEGPTNVCAYIVSVGNPTGTIAEYKVKKAPGATSYNWTAPAGATIVAHPNGTGADDTVVHIIYGAGFSSGSISVTSSNGCGSSLPRLRSVTTLQTGAPGNITAVELQSCPDRIISYSIPAMPSNSESVEWAVPAGGVITSGQGTTSITVSYGAGAIVGNVSITASNNCSPSRTRNLSVKLAACSAPRVFTKAAPVSNLEVSVFPNPSQHEFRVRVKSPEAGKVQVRVIDIMGRQLSATNMNAGETLHLGAELKTGTYFIEVMQGEKRIINKVIKQ